MNHNFRETAAAHTAKIRDVVRHQTHELSGDTLALRVPYDLFNPVGPVQLDDAKRITYLQAGELRTGRTAPSRLDATRPGERVLVRLPPDRADADWWLCEVEAVDGVPQD